MVQDNESVFFGDSFNDYMRTMCMDAADVFNAVREAVRRIAQRFAAAPAAVQLLELLAEQIERRVQRATVHVWHRQRDLDELFMTHPSFVR